MNRMLAGDERVVAVADAQVAAEPWRDLFMGPTDMGDADFSPAGLADASQAAGIVGGNVKALVKSAGKLLPIRIMVTNRRLLLGCASPFSEVRVTHAPLSAVSASRRRPLHMWPLPHTLVLRIDNGAGHDVLKFTHLSGDFAAIVAAISVPSPFEGPQD